MQIVNYDGRRTTSGSSWSEPFVAGNVYGASTTRRATTPRRVPCANGAARSQSTRRRSAKARSRSSSTHEDAAGNPGTLDAGHGPRSITQHPVPSHVDLEGGEAWRNQNDFRRLLGQPGRKRPGAHRRRPLPDLPRRQAGLHRGQTQPGVGICALDDLSVPGPGEWQLRVWREDAAATTSRRTRPCRCRSRYDPEPPQLALRAAAQPSDPTLVSVAVTDRVSGLAGGRSKSVARGTGVWQSLATDRHGDRLLARIDDAALPRGHLPAPRDRSGPSRQTRTAPTGARPASRWR